jgi:hypothetical protein
MMSSLRIEAGRRPLPLSPLDAAVTKLEFQLDVLKAARTPYTLMLASKKNLENRLIKEASGKSIAEKTMNAYATSEWESFSLELARLEDIYEYESLKFEVLKVDYQTKYLLTQRVRRADKEISVLTLLINTMSKKNTGFDIVTSNPVQWSLQQSLIGRK